MHGGDDHERRIRALASFLQDLRPFWPMVRRTWIGWVSRTFDSQGAFLGSSWEELSEPYAEWKARWFPGRSILSLVGTLRRQATTPTVIATPSSLELIVSPYDHPAFRVGGRTVPSRRVEPLWFQEGTTSMPARPLAATGPEMMTPSMHAELHRVGVEYADDLIRRLRLG
jgi:hypothetical protein